MPIGLVGVVVSPGTAVPVGTEHDALLLLWSVAGYNVVAEQGRAVVALEGGALFGDTHAVVLELGGNPLSTLLVGLAVHGARSEVALLLAEQVGGVGREGGSDGFGDLCGGVVAALGTAAGGEGRRDDGCKEGCLHRCL